MVDPDRTRKLKLLQLPIDALTRAAHQLCDLLLGQANADARFADVAAPRDTMSSCQGGELARRGGEAAVISPHPAPRRVRARAWPEDAAQRRKVRRSSSHGTLRSSHLPAFMRSGAQLNICEHMRSVRPRWIRQSQCCETLSKP